MTIFYEKKVSQGVRNLSEEESKHCAQVLRHQIGDEITVFDGNGGIYHCILTHVSKKKCDFEIKSSEIKASKPFSIHLAIAPTKSTDRIEWMVEKLCEIGIDEITFIQTQHSERRKLRIDRMEKKVISAMKQSKNPFKMVVNELTPIETLLIKGDYDEKWIAHVNADHKYLGNIATSGKSTLILIGPEGDFSEDELELAIANGFNTVSLGKNTLRTETAGFVSCCIINGINEC